MPLLVVLQPGTPRGLTNHTYNADVFMVQGRSQVAEHLESHRELLLQNSSGQPALGWGGLHVYDHAQEKVRNLWRDNCLALTASGVIDGCGADFSGASPKAAGVSPVAVAAWSAGHTQMMRDTTVALAEGMLVGKDFPELGDYVNAILREGCTASNETVNEFRDLSARAKATGKRYVAQCHFGHPEYVPPLNLSAAECTAAAFLCCAGEDQYFATSDWWSKDGTGTTRPYNDHGNFSTHWLPSIMGRALGRPLADATYDSARGVWDARDV